MIALWLIVDERTASAKGVRRDKVALSSGRKPHPATAPAGSNRSSHASVENDHSCHSSLRRDKVLVPRFIGSRLARIGWSGSSDRPF